MREPPGPPDVGMSEMGPHPDLELSAYVDDALDEPDRARVADHLAGCATCTARARELSATAAVLRALPDPRPSRSLVPPLARAPAWYAPARLLSGIASGVFALLFLAAALGPLGTPRAATTAAAPAAAPKDLATGADGRAPGVGVAASASAAAESAQRLDNAASASPGTRDAQPAPPSAFAVPASPARASSEPAPAGPAPLLWLGLALAAGAAAVFLHVRMRAG